MGKRAWLITGTAIPEVAGIVSVVWRAAVAVFSLSLSLSPSPPLFDCDFSGADGLRVDLRAELLPDLEPQQRPALRTVRYLLPPAGGRRAGQRR